MLSRLQENAVDRLALEHGRVAVRDGFADGEVRATVPSGAEFKIGEGGIPREVGVNFSVDWSE